MTRDWAKLGQIGLVIAASIMGALACKGGDTSYADSDPSAVLRVHRSSFQTSIRLSGVLRAADSASITSPQGAWGVAIRWMADDGALVAKGDKVLEIDNSAIIGTLDNLREALISARNDLLQQRNTSSINISDKEQALEQAEYSLRKAKLDAAVPRDAYPRRTYEDMQLALDRATSEHSAALKALQTERRIAALALEQKQLALGKAERNIEGVEAKLEDYVLKAPRDGLLVAGENWQEGRSFRTGDKTWPGQVVLQIPNLAVMNIEAELSDVDDGRLHLGMSANCVLDAYPDRFFPAKIVSISPVAQAPGRESLRRAFKVTLELEETDQERMRPGMSVQVEVLDKKEEGVLLVPRVALRFDKDGVVARLANGDQALVTIGRCSTQECVLVEGPPEGSKLSRMVPR